MVIRRIILSLAGSLLLGALTLPFDTPPAVVLDTILPESAAAVVINEVAWSGTTASYADEWIELYNNTPLSISLTNWRLTTADGMNLVLHGDISPYGYYLIERTDDTTISDIPAQWTGPFGGYGLSDTGETITLTNAADQVVDTANADGGTWPAGDNNPDYSMERINSRDADIEINWATHAGMPRNGLDALGNPINGTPLCRNTTASPAADLVVEKIGPSDMAQDTNITYTLRLRNTGNLIAQGVQLTDTLPSGITYLTSTWPHPTALDSRTLRWDFNDIPIAITPISITLVAHIPAETAGMISNHVTSTSLITEATPGTNVAVWTTSVHAPAPILNLNKVGPIAITASTPMTYYLTIRNIGDFPASGVLITDTLPDGLALITQSAPYPAHQPVSTTLVWDVGDLAPDVTGHITLTLQPNAITTVTLTNVATATAATGERVTATWHTAVRPQVWLYAAQPGNYDGSSGEAVALINMSAYPVNLEGWCLDDQRLSTSRACFADPATISPGDIVWLAQNADGFYRFWGFDADWASKALTKSISLLAGLWPGFTDDGEAIYLLDDTGIAIDVLAYGKGIPETGWTGAAVPHPYAGYEAKGQVLYRKLDQHTGRPIPDTNTANDWAQAPDDPINGRKLRYPGWDLETLFFPIEVTATTHVTLAVAPDGMLDTVLETVAKAQHSLIIEGYTLGSIPLLDVINARIQAGVNVTILLESSPAGGMNDEERWVAQHLHQPPTSTVYFMGGTAARYRYQHAKFIVVDKRVALISTDNFGESSMPSDIKSNGTMGHRGFVALTDSAGAIARLHELFAYDCDPIHHQDIFTYSDAFAPPDDFIPIPPFDWTTYTVAFSPTLVTTTPRLTLVHAPEHALRDQDALLGLIRRTLTGTIDIMQMSEPVTWTDNVGQVGLNPRIMALIQAAQRGIHVRLLLDAYYDDPTAANTNTAACLYLNALPLNTLHCRLVNATGEGIHAKIFLVDTGTEHWVHLGSINGTESAHKVNRELAIQFESKEAHDYLHAVFAHDWELGHWPMIHRRYMPIVAMEYVKPAEYPLITEVFINPEGEDSNREWVEIYNPDWKPINIAGWSIGDAINAGDYGDGRYIFPNGAQLLPKQIIVAAACATNFSAQYGFNPTYEWINCDNLVADMISPAQWEGFGIALGNTSDEFMLLNTTAAIVDSVAWAGIPRVNVIPFPLDVGSTFPWGATLKRFPPNYDYDDCSSDFYISYQPSPGLVGSTR